MICYDSALAMTGEIYYGRCDPDAVSYQRNDQAPGNYLISAIARTDYPHERVILDALHTSKQGVDGCFFTDIALHAPDIDRIQNAGRIVVTNDGTPGINVVVNGQRQFVPLVRKVLIRQTSTHAEVRLNQWRTRSLRAIPEDDPDFSNLFGLREDTESMHYDLKDRLWNRRARSVGHQRRTLDEIRYQLHQGITALIAWQIRTDGELRDHFGMWKPPDKPRRRQAA